MSYSIVREVAQAMSTSPPKMFPSPPHKSLVPRSCTKWLNDTVNVKDSGVGANVTPCGVGANVTPGVGGNVTPVPSQNRGAPKFWLVQLKKAGASTSTLLLRHSQMNLGINNQCVHVCVCACMYIYICIYIYMCVFT